VKAVRLRLGAKSFLLVALMLMVIVAVVFGVDLIDGRWDQPLIQPPL
jgi:hypothetical protein